MRRVEERWEVIWVGWALALRASSMAGGREHGGGERMKGGGAVLCLCLSAEGKSAHGVSSRRMWGSQVNYGSDYVTCLGGNIMSA